MGEGRPLLERVKASHPYTAWKRYGDANGDLLAAGVGYYAFFSVFPALALAFAVFGFVLQGRPDLLQDIANYLNGVLPGMVRTAENPDGLIGLSPPETLTLTITGLVSLATLLFSGLGWVGAMRSGIRSVFGLPASPGNAVTTKLRDFVVLLSLGVGVAVSAILTTTVGGLAEQVAGWIGIGTTETVVTVVGLLLGLAFDALLMALLLRVLSGAPLPWTHVREGALLGAVALTVLKYFGGVLIARASASPLLGAVAVSVGLLFWLNLMARVALLSAAWAANDADLKRPARRAEGEPAPVEVTTPSPYAAEPPGVLTRSRAVDRVSLAAGVVLGALVAGVGRGARRRRAAGR